MSSAAVMDFFDTRGREEELRRKLEEGRAELERLRLRDEVMREWINHNLEKTREPLGLLCLHMDAQAESNCRECSRLISTFFPDVPWRGWAL